MSCWLIGSDSECDLVVDQPVVSGRHCRLTRAPDGDFLEDLESTNGTFVNGVRVRGRVRVRRADRITLGKRTPMPWPLEDKLEDKREPVPNPVIAIGRVSEMTFGRDPACDRVLDFPMVSRRHAHLSRDGTAFRIQDLGSSNGTYVNGVRVRGTAEVRPGDRIGLGSCTFTLTISGDLDWSDERDDLSLEARDLAVSAAGRTLIEAISLRVDTGQLVGLIGPSGAGKSTLMKALAGYLKPSHGAVLLDGADLEHHHAEFRGQIGYVPQEDIIHSDLTVGEALRFTARLRLPSDYGDAEIRRRVREVLDRLDLAGAEDTLVGAPGGWGISGGQRKRVNLAMEFLTDPPILLLDEPTSGLSSEDTLRVLKILRRLADRGKTILLTIHQPGKDAFRMLDRVAVVARDPDTTGPGRLVYDGPAYPDAIHFFNPPAAGGPASRSEGDPSPDDLLRGLARRPVGEWVERLAASRGRTGHATPRAGRPAGSSDRGPVPQDLRRSSITQWWTLARRSVARKRKDAWNTAILLAQAPIIALLIVLVFGRQARPGTLADLEHWTEAASGVASTTFILGLAALWFGCSNAVREIVGEWPVYQRERMVNLKLGPYIGSKIATLGGLCLFQCAILLTIARFGIGLKADLPMTFGILVLASSVGLALGLAISAVARTSEVAIALLPLTILPLLIFGGALQALHKMHPVLQFACNAFPSRWAFEGLIVLESDRRPPAPIPSVTGPTESTAANATSRDMAETYFPAGTDRMGPRAAVVALAGMFVFLVALIAAILRRATCIERFTHDLRTARSACRSY